MKRNSWFVLLLVIFTSCSLTVKRAEKKGMPPVDPGAIKESPNMPPDINYQDLGDSQKRDLWEVDKLVVWIEGIGVDSYYYLGFLQEFEKESFSIKKIVGTGSACWIAQSWASENKGSYAEWQSFKLNDWKVLEQGFLDRWTSASSLGSFRKNIKPILPSRLKRLFKVKYDCPFQAERSGRWISMNSNYLDLAEEFWVQMQVPQIVRELDLSALNKRSGLKITPPKDDEIEKWFSFNNQHDRNTTLVLLLSNPLVRKEFGGRSSSFVKKHLKNGLRVIRAELGHKIIKSPELYRDFKKRRLLMLEGRNEAIKLLSNPSNRGFLGLKLFP